MTDSTDFPVILILTVGRSGSNLLADMLGNIDGNLRMMEVFHPRERGNIDLDPALFSAVQNRLNCQFSGINDAKLGWFIDKDRLRYFDALCGAAQDLGFGSLSCKFFPKHILISELTQILARPNLRVIFLTRRRIDRHISWQKARILTNFTNADTTALLPDLDVADFLDSAVVLDKGMDGFWDAVQAASCPFTILEYDRDLNIDNDLRNRRVEEALHSIGVLPRFRPYTQPDWFKKQDLNQDWRDKIGNGFLAAASLAGLGLLDYAQSAPLMDILPTQGEDGLSRAKLTSHAQYRPELRDQLLAEYGNFRAFAKDPMVTMTSMQFGRSYFAEAMAEPDPVLAGRSGVHFLKPTWSMQTQPLTELAKTLRQAEHSNPGHIFIALHVNDAEAENYRKSGIRSIFGNHSVFEDERPWAEDAPPLAGVPDADALMIAILAGWKNHHLAAELDSLHLIYGKPAPEDLARVRGLCPRANFINHRGGDYGYLERPQMQGMMSRAKVSLALSKEEGAMRASTESLLAGLPVVSTASIGGRDICYGADNSLIVEPTPQAVRQGVQSVIARNLTRAEVRRATMDLIRPLRRDFEQGANRAIAAHLGPLAPELRVQDIFGILNEYQRLGNFIMGLK